MLYEPMPWTSITSEVQWPELTRGLHRGDHDAGTLSTVETRWPGPRYSSGHLITARAE